MLRDASGLKADRSLQADVWLPSKGKWYAKAADRKEKAYPLGSFSDRKFLLPSGKTYPDVEALPCYRNRN